MAATLWSALRFRILQHLNCKLGCSPRFLWHCSTISRIRSVIKDRLWSSWLSSCGCSWLLENRSGSGFGRCLRLRLAGSCFRFGCTAASTATTATQSVCAWLWWCQIRVSGSGMIGSFAFGSIRWRRLTLTLILTFIIIDKNSLIDNDPCSGRWWHFFFGNNLTRKGKANILRDWLAGTWNQRRRKCKEAAWTIVDNITNSRPLPQ